MKGVVIYVKMPNTTAIRQLVPKSYHFDGYNELHCPNARDKPFFTDTAIQMGNYTLTTRLIKEDVLEILFSSVCPEGKIVFQPFKLTLELYIQKLKAAIQEKVDFIYLEISPIYSEDLQCLHYCYYNKIEDCKNLCLSKPGNVFTAISFDMEKVQKALSIYHGITNNNNLEENNMNQIFVKGNKSVVGTVNQLSAKKEINAIFVFIKILVKIKETNTKFKINIKTLQALPVEFLY